jgi:hypothetical protein
MFACVTCSACARVLLSCRATMCAFLLGKALRAPLFHDRQLSGHFSTTAVQVLMVFSLLM